MKIAFYIMALAIGYCIGLAFGSPIVGEAWRAPIAQEHTTHGKTLLFMRDEQSHKTLETAKNNSGFMVTGKFVGKYAVFVDVAVSKVKPSRPRVKPDKTVVARK